MHSLFTLSHPIHLIIVSIQEMLSSRLPRSLRFRHARTHLAIAASLPSRSVTAGTSSHPGRHVYSYNCESSHSSNASSTSLRGRSFGTAAALRKDANGGDKYYVATLPWSDKEEDRKERFNDLIKNARFAENEKIGA